MKAYKHIFLITSLCILYTQVQATPLTEREQLLYAPALKKACITTLNTELALMTNRVEFNIDGFCVCYSSTMVRLLSKEELIELSSSGVRTPLYEKNAMSAEVSCRAELRSAQ